MTLSTNVFVSSVYETSLVGIITEAFPLWENVAAWSANLDVLDDLKEQTIISVLDFDYDLPNLPDGLQHTLDEYNSYVEITGRAYLTQPLRRQTSFWELKDRVAALMALIPQVNIDGGQRLFARPLTAEPLVEKGSPVAAYVLSWFDIVECTAEVSVPEPEAGLITRINIDLLPTLE